MRIFCFSTITLFGRLMHWVLLINIAVIFCCCWWWWSVFTFAVECRDHSILTQTKIANEQDCRSALFLQHKKSSGNPGCSVSMSSLQQTKRKTCHDLDVSRCLFHFSHANRRQFLFSPECRNDIAPFIYSE